jgi:dihydroorotase
MNQRFDTILKSGTVVNQDGEGVCDIGITNGRIAAIGGLGQASSGETIDCKGLHILPGVIDTQVHFREPGLTHKEDLASGSLSAVMGGVTAVFEMPNTDPLTVSAETLADKVKRGHHRMHCDFAFFVTLPNWSAFPVVRASRCSWAHRPDRCFLPTMPACARYCSGFAAAPLFTPRTSRG